MSSALRDRRRSTRRATMLYSTGREAPLRDGSVIYLQAMNSLERDEAVNDAQAARARLALALRDEDSQEALKVRVMFMADGVEGQIRRLREAHQNDAYLEVVDEIEADEEWTERVHLLRQSSSLVTPPSEEEREHLTRIAHRFTEEVGRRLEQALDAEERRVSLLTDEERWDEYLQWWSEMRGGEVAIVEYRYTELFHAARVCVGTEEDGRWDHSECEQHALRVYDDKDELRHLPEDFLAEMFGHLAEMEVSEREAKLQAAVASSSEPSVPRSSQADSEPSTPEGTSSPLPGTS